ncbi:MAG: peptidoglycan-binding protein [Acidobacteriia bacterium]|nr:peptidoglycan-binding protein [Terriglobia bacterium]
MFLASKVAWAGIVFLLLATGISGPRPAPLTSGVDLSKEGPAVPHPNDVMSMQQTLLDKGHYRGKVDGVFGLLTRASIRAYQKAESLPVTGQLDKETAGRLGVRPEVRQETRFVTTQDKPPAGTKLTKGSGRARKTPQRPVERTRPVPPT